MDQRFFKTAFAATGDRSEVPMEVDPDGEVSYPDGYGPRYSLNPATEPLALPISRANWNALFHDVTDAVGAMQRMGAPEWITAANNGGVDYPYEAGAEVIYRALPSDPWVRYESLVNSNTAVPGTDPSKWATVSDLPARVQVLEQFKTRLQTSAPADGAELVGFRRSILASTVEAANIQVQDFFQDLPIVTAEFQGIDKTGATDSSTAWNNMINAISAVSPGGAVIHLPQGTIKLINAQLPQTGHWAIRGVDKFNTRVIANANGSMFVVNDIYGVSYKHFENFSVYGNGFASVTAFDCTKVRNFKLNNVHFEDTHTDIVIDRCRGFDIHDITVRNAGAWVFHSTDENDFIKSGSITNVLDSYGQNLGVKGIDSWLTLADAINVYVEGFNTGGQFGTARGMKIQGKCEGILAVNNCFVWNSVSVFMEPITYGFGTVSPEYCWFIGMAMDQFTVSGMILDGDNHFVDNFFAVNGNIWGNSGAAIRVNASCQDVIIANGLVRNNDRDGIVIEAGAKVYVTGVKSYDNNKIAGSFFDVRDLTTVYGDANFGEGNRVDTYSSSVQRIVRGRTSKVLSVQSSANNSTTAVTTEEVLKTYTLPANTLKAGEYIDIEAWGTVGANANQKTVRLYFGASNLGGVAGTLNGVNWYVRARVYANGAASERYIRDSAAGVSVAAVGTGDIAENLATALNIQLRGQNGVASAGDITCTGLVARLVN